LILQLIEETAKNYLSSLLLETNLSAAIEKIFWKKKTCKFFLLNPTKPEPYDHGMKENNEHL